MAKKSILFCLLLIVTATTIARAGQIKLLQGRLLLNVPPEFKQWSRKPPKDHRYEHLASFRTRDGDWIDVTYGKHTQDEANLDQILRDEVTSFTHLNEIYSHFRWLTHKVTRVAGRRWGDVSFSHESKKDIGDQFYARCISTFVDGRLLEIWAVTRHASLAGRKSWVDHQIESVRLTQ